MIVEKGFQHALYSDYSSRTDNNYSAYVESIFQDRKGSPSASLPKGASLRNTLRGDLSGMNIGGVTKKLGKRMKSLKLRMVKSTLTTTMTTMTMTGVVTKTVRVPLKLQPPGLSPPQSPAAVRSTVAKHNKHQSPPQHKHIRLQPDATPQPQPPTSPLSPQVPVQAPMQQSLSEMSPAQQLQQPRQSEVQLPEAKSCKRQQSPKHQLHQPQQQQPQ